MRFAFYTRKNGKLQEYSGIFMSFKEAQQWFEDHGEWIEKNLKRKLHLFKLKSAKNRALIKEEI